MKNNRILRNVYILALVIIFALIINVFFVSIGKIHARSLTDLKPYVESVSLISENIYGERGLIYDSNGQAVAQNESTYDIICYLSKTRKGTGKEIAYVDDPLYTAQVLANILNADEKTIYALLTPSNNLYQTELGQAGRNLSQATVDRIKADKNLHGIGFKASTKRNYPLQEFFAPYFLGFAKSDENGKLVGKMGVEAYLNTELSGVDGKHIYQADKNGYVLPGMYDEITPAQNGNDVYLTFDVSIQEALYTAFEEVAEENGAVQAWGAVMQVSDGKLLAAGQYPSFDPNTAEISDYNNYLTQYAYEPGSVLKSIIYSAAIDTGVYDGDAEFDSSSFCYYSTADNIPHRVYDGASYGCINNAANKNWGMIPLDYGLIYSSNVATSTLLTQYLSSPLVFEEYLQKFGFFQKVNTDGLQEVTGTKNYYYPSEKLALTYGQGSSVTTIQLLQAYSAIFGNGEMVKPYYIDKVVNEDGEIVYEGQRTVSGQPIKEETAKKMQALLERVVSDEGGTAKFYGIDEVKIAAKTGTSEIAIIGSGYDSNMTISSVMMAFPAEKPEIMIYFAFIAPYDYNMHARSKPINDMTRKVYILTSNAEKRVYTNDNSTKENIYLDDYTGKTADEAYNELSSSAINFYIIGNGNVIRQYPSPAEELNNNDKVFIITDSSEYQVPDFTDWTRKEILNFKEVSGIDIEIEDYGVVYEQNIAPGTTVNKTEKIILKMRDIHYIEPSADEAVTEE